jgi:hypothetical protein
LKAEFKDLTAWWKKVLGNDVANVKVSNRLATTPCVVVAGKYGHSANMERIMRAQVGYRGTCCSSVHLCFLAQIWQADSGRRGILKVGVCTCLYV